MQLDLDFGTNIKLAEAGRDAVLVMLELDAQHRRQPNHGVISKTRASDLQLSFLLAGLRFTTDEIAEGKAALERVGIIETRADGSVFMPSHAEWGPPKSGAERMAKSRSSKRPKGDLPECDGVQRHSDAHGQEQSRALSYRESSRTAPPPPSGAAPPATDAQRDWVAKLEAKLGELGAQAEPEARTEIADRLWHQRLTPRDLHELHGFAQQAGDPAATLAGWLSEDGAARRALTDQRKRLKLERHRQRQAEANS